MRKGAKRAGIALILTLCSWCCCARDAQAGNTYPHSADGFRSQLDALKQAYCFEDAQGAGSLQEQFKIPEAKSWFEQRFDPGTAAQLEARYEKAFSSYTKWMKTNLLWGCMVDGLFSVTAPSEVNAKPTRDDDKGSNIRPSAEVAVDQFGFEVKTEAVDSVKWVETFTYVDGAFRFLGIGASPFWAWEEGADARFPEVHIERPQLVRQVQPPFYPEKAYKKHVAGDVMVAATIDEEGNVTDVKVVTGDPLLRDSAVSSIKQWKFKPLIIGGKASRFRMRIVVTFHNAPRPNS